MGTLGAVSAPAEVRAMFDRIAPEYDRFNALASFGMHRGWRETLVGQIPPCVDVLDVATGTGDIAIAARDQGHQVIGLDFSQAMIRRAQTKDPNNSIRWVVGSADQLPFAENSFGCITSAFALRNFRGLDAVFRESYRVLLPGGRVLHMDFGRPKQPLLRLGCRLHMTWGVSLIGRMLFGERWPKDYLAKTIDQFLEPAEVEDCLEAAGFINVRRQPLFGGVVQIYKGTKPC